MLDMLSVMTDEQLAAAAKNSPEALEALILRHTKLVRQCARPLFLAGADHEDLVQEGMIGLLSAVRSYDARCGSPFQAYAALCIRRRMISAIRAAASQKHAPLNDAVSLHEFCARTDGQTDPEEQLLRRERCDEYMRYLQEHLSGTELRVLRLYLDGLSYSEISQALSRPVKSVDNAVRRIRKKAANYQG